MTATFLTRARLRGHLEQAGESVVVEGDVLVLPVPWNASMPGRVEIRWGDSDVRVEVPMPVAVKAQEAAAVAVSAQNSEHKLVVFRLTSRGVVAGLAAPLEPDGRLSSTVLERLLGICRAVALRALRPIDEAASGRPRPRHLAGSVTVTLGDEVDGLVELIQPWFVRHAILEARSGERFVRRGSGELQPLTLELLDQIARDELADVRFDDEAAARDLALAVNDWVPRSPTERRRPTPAPRVVMGVSGPEVVFVVDDQGRSFERTVFLGEPEVGIAIRDA